MMRRSLAVLALAPVLLANQCYRGFDVQVSPGPKPKQAVITGVRKGQPVELTQVSVFQCRPGVVPHMTWSATVNADTVAYGAELEAARVAKPAEPLQAGGCYQVSAGGRLRTNERGFGSGGFRVAPDGTVLNGTGALGRRLANEQEVDRAAVGCRRGYRRARTPADSAGVDARVWPVSDTTITCGFLRNRSPETIARAESTERLLLQAAGGILAAAVIWRLGDMLPKPSR